MTDRMSKETGKPARNGEVDSVLSTSNLAIVRRSVAAWNNGDLDAWLETLDPFVEICPPRPDVYDSPFEGHDGARRFAATLRGEWGQMRLASESFHASGTKVLALGYLEARGRISGLRLRTSAAWLIQLHERLIVRWKFYTDQNEALKEAGLRR
jgi:ketosteroid isomerase-like protein